MALPSRSQNSDWGEQAGTNLQVAAGEVIVDEQGDAVVPQLDVQVCWREILVRAVGVIQVCAFQAGGHGVPAATVHQLQSVTRFAVDHQHLALIHTTGGGVVQEVLQIDDGIAIQLERACATSAVLGQIDGLKVV